MKGFKNVLVTLAALAGATATALPASEPQENNGGCIVPQIIYSTLPNPFTVSVLPGPDFSSAKAWPLQVDPRNPSRQTPSKPIISNTRIRQPEFRLTDGKLLLDNFPAQVYPVPLIFPPPLTPWVFGGEGGGLTTATFAASYSCDAEGNAFLRLRADDGASGKLCR